MAASLHARRVGSREGGAHLTGLERLLLLLPLAGGTFFGLMPLLAPGFLASFFGYPGNDHYVYRIAGAATIGYAVVLAMGLMERRWASIRLPVIATLVFNLASILACLFEIVNGVAQPVVYLILATSIAIVCITGFVLSNHREVTAEPADTAPWVTWLLVVATAAAATFGLLALFIPVDAGHLFNFKATDTFLYRQAGAATLGYAVMGVYELISRRWSELRLPFIMALVFNGVSFVVSALALLMGETSWVLYIIGPASLLVTIGMTLALQRQGK